jgi:hypothetical protein
MRVEATVGQYLIWWLLLTEYEMKISLLVWIEVLKSGYDVISSSSGVTGGGGEGRGAVALEVVVVTLVR